MDIIGGLLWPIKWAVEAILVGWHWLFTQIGLSSASGLSWTLSIIGLVLVIRALLIPLFVKQIKSQRKMLEIAPQAKKIQEKYKGKTDQFSRQAMAQEQMALYKENGTNPMSSCMPILLQMPIFFGLFSVLNEAQHGNAGVGALNQEYATEFANSKLFGVAPLSATLSGSLDPIQWPVVIIAAVLVILMVASQFFTQLQIMGKNVSPETAASPMFKQQKMLLYVLPFVLVFSGIAFPLGVLFYWFTSNIWTMVQQFLVIRNMPTPGSQAYLARQERLRKKGKLDEDEKSVQSAEEQAIKGQRNQPVGKKRGKKQSKPNTGNKGK